MVTPMPEFEGRQTHYYGDGCPEHPAEAADHPIWCGWVNGRPGDPESRICTCRYFVDPSGSADLLAPCPKCGHYRDTPNHTLGCAGGDANG